MSEHSHQKNGGKACCTASRGHDPGNKAAIHDTVKRISEGSVEGMIRLQGGNFLMGTEDKDGFPEDGEGPVREVAINPFYIDQATVTNAEFRRFIKETGYKSEAEKYGWSFVFYQLLPDDILDAEPPHVSQTPWWRAVEGADWQHPEGPGSTILTRLNHPVIHVSWNDAMAYAKWSGKRLPTEAEWEYAARGGLEQQRFPWGDELEPGGKHKCNVWQGTFPTENTLGDGFLGTAPAKYYEPNGYGLYNVSGNVWEWCMDWFSPDFHQNELRENPTGPAQGEAKIIRGGSYLCHASYCNRYRVAARTSNTPDSSTGNMGFRCVRDV